jgi:hypothetical protein
MFCPPKMPTFVGVSPMMSILLANAMQCLLEISSVALNMDKLFIGDILCFALPKCQALLESV